MVTTVWGRCVSVPWIVRVAASSGLSHPSNVSLAPGSTVKTPRAAVGPLSRTFEPAGRVTFCPATGTFRRFQL